MFLLEIKFNDIHSLKLGVYMYLQATWFFHKKPTEVTYVRTIHRREYLN